MTLFNQIIGHYCHKLTHLILWVRHQERSIHSQFGELELEHLHTHTTLTKVYEFFEFSLPFVARKETIKESPYKNLLSDRTRSEGPIVSPLGLPCLSYII